MSYLATRSLPAQLPANTLNVANDGTADLYGHQDSLVLTPSEHRIADLGAMFTFSNPTIGTGVATGAAGAGTTSFSATSAMFTFNNTAAAGTGKRVWFRSLRLCLTTAPTATVSLESAWVKDAVSRAPSAGNVAITPVSSLLTSKTTPVTAIQAFTAANMTVPAAGPNAQTVGRVRIPTGLGVVGDSYVFSFGGMIDPTSGSSSTGSTRTSASAPGTFVGNGPPIIIEPQEWLVVYIWWLTAATSAPAFEYDGSFIEL